MLFYIAEISHMFLLSLSERTWSNSKQSPILSYKAGMDAKTKPKADMDVWTALTHTANFQTQREAH